MQFTLSLLNVLDGLDCLQSEHWYEEWVSFKFFLQQFKIKFKKMQKSVDKVNNKWYYNQVATRDERHKSFSNTDKYWVWKQWTLITEQKDNLENSF